MIYKQSVDAVEVNIIQLSAPETIFVEYPTVDPVDILVTFLFPNIIFVCSLRSLANIAGRGGGGQGLTSLP